METWSVAIEATGLGPYDCDWASDVLEALDGHAPALAVRKTSVGLTLDVEGTDHADAAREAVRLLAIAAPSLRPLEVRVQTLEEQERELMASNVPELLGVAELAEALGVSRQRVSELMNAEDFPEPIARLRAGPVWQRSALGRFLAGWKRQPGRPHKASSAPA